MATKLQIINRALGLLGQPAITEPDAPESSAGKTLANIYTQVRQGVLSRYLWNFAEVTTNLVRLGDSESLYDDDYLYPEKCLKLLKVMSDQGVRNDNFRLGLNVAADARVIQINNQGATLKGVYNYDVENIAHWSPLACEVLSKFLALGGCNTILGKENNMWKLLNEDLAEDLKDAIAVDGQEQKIPVEETYRVEQARLGIDADSCLNVRFP